jgi:TfoX/Sxy family transcriptional regulator of competence genes
MSTNIDFITYVVEQIQDAGNITYKKMFGEYWSYSNAKPVLLVCDNTVFVKILECVEPLLKNAEKGFPYDGAKEHYIADADDGKLLSALVREIEKVTSVPKKKSPKKRKSK